MHFIYVSFLAWIPPIAYRHRWNFGWIPAWPVQLGSERMNSSMLNRRNWIKSAVMAAAGAEMHNSLRADVVCGPPVPPYGVQACIAGIWQEKMNDVEAFQEQRQWCWAACIEMVFTYWGHPIDQQEIVRRTRGRIVDM